MATHIVPIAEALPKSQFWKAVLYTSTDNVVVDTPGPPEVITHIISKCCNPAIIPKSKIKNMIFFIDGSTIFVKTLKLLAPSILAASTIS